MGHPGIGRQRGGRWTWIWAASCSSAAWLCRPDAPDADVPDASEHLPHTHLVNLPARSHTRASVFLFSGTQMATSGEFLGQKAQVEMTWQIFRFLVMFRGSRRAGSRSSTARLASHHRSHRISLGAETAWRCRPPASAHLPRDHHTSLFRALAGKLGRFQ